VIAFYMSASSKPDTGVNDQLRELLSSLNFALSGKEFLTGVGCIYSFSGDFTLCRVLCTFYVNRLLP
jgi:hypothetical protein